MSLRVCYTCKKVTRHFTNPFQDLPCSHKTYDYANENQRKINEKDSIEWVNPVDRDGQEINEFSGSIPDFAKVKKP